ncbi:MAG: hypothetical protein V8R46_04620 [Eubacterium ramulus]
MLSDTDLADYYAAHPFPLFSMEEYCDFSNCWNISTIYGRDRITGDGRASFWWHHYGAQIRNGC